MNVTAVVPVKRLGEAKQRLAGDLSADLRRALALAMLRDVLATLAAVPALPVIVATSDPDAAALARRFGAKISADSADAGHTEAVAACARALAREGSAMLTLPADIPLVTEKDVAAILAALEGERGFVIVPARDGLGSNAVLCAPADAVPLTFGGASFARHLAAARARGIVAKTLVLPRVGLDIDTAGDLAAFLAIPSRTHARALLERHTLVEEARA